MQWLWYTTGLAYLVCCGVLDVYSSEFLHKYYNMNKEIRKKNYDSAVIPWNDNHPLIVNMSFKLEYIVKFIEKDQILESVIYNSFEWYDSRLAWDPADYMGIRSVILPPDTVWKPDILLQNSVDHSAYLSLLDPGAHVHVSNTGKLLWCPYHTAKTFCAVDAFLFPFDIQTCHFWLTSWAYPYDVLQMQPIIGSTSKLTPNSSEWTIIGTNSTIVDSFEVTWEGQKFVHLQHTVVMRRNITFYNVVILTPCVILTLLTLLLFVLPSGERMELGLAIWTSLVLFLLMVNDSFPSSSGKIPILGMYIIAMLILVTGSLIMAVLGLRYHDKSGKDLPAWLHKLLVLEIRCKSCRKTTCDDIDGTGPSGTLDSRNECVKCARDQMTGSDNVSSRLDRQSIIGQGVIILLLLLAITIYYILS